MSIGMVSGNSHMIQSMEQMKLAAQNRPSAAQKSDQVGASFTDTLAAAIKNVNQVQKTSSSTSREFILGNPDVSIADVIQASNRSSIAFEATKVTRNKLLEGFKEVLNTPL